MNIFVPFIKKEQKGIVLLVKLIKINKIVINNELTFIKLISILRTKIYQIDLININVLMDSTLRLYFFKSTRWKGTLKSIWHSKINLFVTNPNIFIIMFSLIFSASKGIIIGYLFLLYIQSKELQYDRWILFNNQLNFIKIILVCLSIELFKLHKLKKQRV